MASLGWRGGMRDRGRLYSAAVSWDHCQTHLFVWYRGKERACFADRRYLTLSRYPAEEETIARSGYRQGVLQVVDLVHGLTRELR
jgi:hypothetical protein